MLAEQIIIEGGHQFVNKSRERNGVGLFLYRILLRSFEAFERNLSKLNEEI